VLHDVRDTRHKSQVCHQPFSSEGGKEIEAVGNRTIYITEYDMTRLRELIGDMKRFAYYGRDDIKDLEAELDRGQLVAPQDVPHDVITMNSEHVW